MFGWGRRLDPCPPAKQFEGNVWILEPNEQHAAGIPSVRNHHKTIRFSNGMSNINESLQNVECKWICAGRNKLFQFMWAQVTNHRKTVVFIQQLLKCNTFSLTFEPTLKKRNVSSTWIFTHRNKMRECSFYWASTKTLSSSIYLWL